jgi:nitrogen regulatory protein PII-like uncharacterized protein
MIVELSEKDILLLDAMLNAFYVIRIGGTVPEEFNKLHTREDMERVVREVNRQVVEQIPALEEIARNMGVI